VVSISLGYSGLCWTVFARNRDTAVPAEGNGDLQTLICVLVARPRRCLTLSNPVPWQNWMAAYLGYTLRMKTLFRGWPVTVNDTHTRRRRQVAASETGKNMTNDGVICTYVTVECIELVNQRQVVVIRCQVCHDETTSISCASRSCVTGMVAVTRRNVRMLYTQVVDAVWNRYAVPLWPMAQLHRLQTLLCSAHACTHTHTPVRKKSAELNWIKTN